MRLYEIEGSPAVTSVTFLGKQRSFQELNLLEEEIKRQSEQQLKASPYEIKTIKLRIER